MGTVVSHPWGKGGFKPIMSAESSGLEHESAHRQVGGPEATMQQYRASSGPKGVNPVDFAWLQILHDPELQKLAFLPRWFLG